MTEIKITYIKNPKGKYDFECWQNKELIVSKEYSPIKSKNQDKLGIAFVDTLQQVANEELQRNPNFMWNSFEEFKAWAGNPETRKRAVNYYKKQELARVKEKNE